MLKKWLSYWARYEVGHYDVHMVGSGDYTVQTLELKLNLSEFGQLEVNLL